MAEFNELPLEVIINIYKYLDVKDIKKAQLTCHQWLNASYIYTEYSERVVFKLSSLNDYNCNLVENSARKYRNIWLYYGGYDADKSIINENELIKFFLLPNVRKHLKFLVFDYCRCKIQINTVLKILELLNNLTDIKFLDISLYDDETENILKDNEKLLNYAETFGNKISRNLNSLALKGYESLVIFSKIKNLKKIDIKLSEYDQRFNSNIYEIFKNNENTLKSISLGLYGGSFVGGNNTFWGKLLLETNLKLDEFHLDSKTSDSWHLVIPDIVAFCKIQTNITRLSLESLYQINDDFMIEIIKNLPNLIELNISDTETLSDLTKYEILKLKNLKYLHCNRRAESNFEITELNNDVHCKLEILKGICLTDQACLKLSLKFPNLRILSFSSTQSTSDLGLQSVIKNCDNLIELEVRGNDFTDFGFTGINLKTKWKTGCALSKLKKLTSLEIPCSKITKETFQMD